MRRWILFSVVAMLVAGASNMSAQVVAGRPGFRSVDRAWLGISYEPVRGRPGDARETLVILEVVDGSPAQRAGIQVGDTLVNINGLRASDELLQ
jgi:S1-C subfamily serine protease